MYYIQRCKFKAQIHKSPSKQNECIIYNFGFLLELKYQGKAFKIWLQASPKTFRNLLYDRKKKREREREREREIERERNQKRNSEKKIATHITGKWLIFLIYKEFLEMGGGGNQVPDRKLFIFSQFTGKEINIIIT